MIGPAPPFSEDATIYGARVKDLDEDCFRDYLERRGLTGIRIEQPPLLEDYENLGVTGEFFGTHGPTVFGVLAFGREPQGFPETRRFLVRNTAYRGESRESGVLLAMEAGGRLDEQVTGTMDWLERLAERADLFDPRHAAGDVLPVMALREAVVNAVFHRDYALTASSVEVDVFRNRIEVTSPGVVPRHMTLHRVRAGAGSRLRNIDMTNYAVGMGLMRRRGQGWLSIKRAMQESNGREPLIEENREGAWVRVTLDLRPADPSPDGDDE